MTSIRKSGKLRGNEHVVLLCNKKTSLGGTGLSEKEIAFVRTQFDKHEKQVAVVNQLGRVVIVQIVESKKQRYLTNEQWRRAGAGLVSYCNEYRIEQITVADMLGDAEAALAFTEGLALGNYQFLKYKKQADKERNPLHTILVSSRKVKDKDLEHLQIVEEAVSRTRNLVNEPVSFLNAVQLAKEFEKMGREAGFRVEVLHKSRIEALKMGGLLAVNRGSVDPPTFTIMEWKPQRAKNKKPLVLVGKGVVYDTGGLSLKPTPGSMDLMKCDMAGSAAVAGAMYAIAKAKLPFHVIGLVPATDNRPGGNAYAPGDVITMMSGLTVEMLNSDAEGRMILADALHYAKRFGPELVLEFSTLTGAAMAAVGSHGIVCMGTADNRVRNKLKESGNNVYERLAEFPFWDEYDELIKSDLAEIKNIGGPQGGAITAGKFLARFTDYPFMHFDIAGPAFLTARESWRGKGGTGVGVRLVFDYLKRK
ncbi:MAG: leucyl aminopeptidase [Bacteroidota bacterium]